MDGVLFTRAKIIVHFLVNYLDAFMVNLHWNSSFHIKASYFSLLTSKLKQFNLFLPPSTFFKEKDKGFPLLYYKNDKKKVGSHGFISHFEGWWIQFWFIYSFFLLTLLIDDCLLI